MNPNVIAGLVKRSYPNFNMYNFDNRLRLQKFTYFLQFGFGVNLGYEFNWYTYGPYCMELTKEGFQVDFQEVKPIKFAEPRLERKFIKFLKFFEKHKKNGEWLEIASSLHLLRLLIPKMPEERMIDIVKNKREELNEKRTLIKKILKELKKEKLIK